MRTYACLPLTARWNRPSPVGCLKPKTRTEPLRCTPLTQQHPYLDGPQYYNSKAARPHRQVVPSPFHALRERRGIPHHPSVYGVIVQDREHDVFPREMQTRGLDEPEEVPFLIKGRRAEVGLLVEGQVVSIKPYGAFIELERGTVGLLHKSQVSQEPVTSLEGILAPFGPIRVVIIAVSNPYAGARRITLSTKYLEPEPGDMLRNPQLVYDRAAETAVLFRARREAEEELRSARAKRKQAKKLGEKLEMERQARLEAEERKDKKVEAELGSNATPVIPHDQAVHSQAQAQELDHVHAHEEA